MSLFRFCTSGQLERRKHYGWMRLVPRPANLSNASVTATVDDWHFTVERVKV